MRRNKNPEMIRHVLRGSLAARGEIAMTACLGIPYYVLEDDVLRARYVLHREQYMDGQMLIYAPHQLAEVNCNTGRIVLLAEIDAAAGYTPVFRMNAEQYYGLQAQLRPELEALEKRLFSLYNETLPCFPTGRETSMTQLDRKRIETVLREYRRVFRSAVRMMGLERLYGGFYDE